MNNKDDRKTKDLQPLAFTLMPLAKKLLGKFGFVEADIITNWPEIIGENLAGYTHPLKIVFLKENRNNGCLYLSVASGAFAVEIKHREKYIIDKINTYFGYNAVSSLKIMQNSENILNKEEKTDLSADESMPEISQKQETYLKNITNDIKNKNLKEILIKLGHSVYTNNNNTENRKDEI